MAGISLESMQNLTDYNIQDNSTLNLVLHARYRILSHAHLNLDQSCLTITIDTDSNKHLLEMRSAHFSCSSDRFDATSNFIGMIVYGYDWQTDFWLNGKHWKTGYVLIKKINAIKHIQTNQNTCFSRLFKWFFNGELSDRFVGTDFSFENGEWKFNSYTCSNIINKHQIMTIPINCIEKEILDTAVNRIYINHQWQFNQNLQLTELLQHVTPSDIKQYQN